MSIFQKILNCRSMTVIDHTVEDALTSDDISDEARQVLQAIINTNKLDEVYALAHDYLGQHEEARKLREFMAKKESALAQHQQAD